MTVAPSAGGNEQEVSATVSSMSVALALSIVLVYLLMVALYNSYRTPFIIMFAVPVVDELGVGKDVNQNAIPSLGLGYALFGGEDRNFLDHLHRRRIRLGEVTGLRLGHVLRLHELDQANLRGVVAVARQRLQLRDHAGAGLQHRNGVHVALLVEDLRHADLFSQDSRNCHIFLASSCGVAFAALPESLRTF